MKITRRSLLGGLAGLLLIGIWRPKGFGEPSGIKTDIEKIYRTDEEWRALLTPAQYRVLRQEGTERPYTSPLLENKERGTYVCAGCELALFTSEMKYASRTGWPSFFTHIEGRLRTKTDYKWIAPRTEYHCARCEGHQGHVFNDGPPPTLQRWCNNGVALNFIPDASPT